jgi:hypothetical protein
VATKFTLIGVYLCLLFVKSPRNLSLAYPRAGSGAGTVKVSLHSYLLFWFLYWGTNLGLGVKRTKNDPNEHLVLIVK